MEYLIAGADSLIELTKKVNHLITMGFSPQGGVSVVYTSSGLFLYQAMIKR